MKIDWLTETATMELERVKPKQAQNVCMHTLAKSCTAPFCYTRNILNRAAKQPKPKNISHTRVKQAMH